MVKKLEILDPKEAVRKGISDLESGLADETDMEEHEAGEEDEKDIEESEASGEDEEDVDF